MAWYRAGTASFVNGSKNVTGTGTQWVNNVRPGDEIVCPDGVSREVEAVTADNTLSMVEVYSGTTTSSAAYKVKPIQGWNRDVAARLAELISDYGSVEAALTVLAGNVGLAASPTERLHVNGNIRVANNAALKIDNASGTPQEVLTVGVDNNCYVGQVSSPSAAGLYAYGSSIIFGGATEYARFNGNGLGVGTTNPTSFGAGYNTLALNGATAGVLELMSGGVSQARFFANGSEARIQVTASTPLVVYTANVQRLSVKATGQLNLVPLTADPAGAAGDLYFNSTTSKFRGHTGSGWVDLH